MKIRSQILYLAKFRLGPAPLASSSAWPVDLLQYLRQPVPGWAPAPPGGIRAGDGAGRPRKAKILDLRSHRGPSRRRNAHFPESTIAFICPGPGAEPAAQRRPLTLSEL